MKRVANGVMLSFMVVVVCVLSTPLANSQAEPARGNAPAPQARPQMVEDLFKNVQLLRGIPVDEFMDTMGMFAAATGLNCTDCHIPESGGSWARYADDNQLKQTARRMIVMVNGLNQSYFGGRRVVTCYSCHNGSRQPRVMPNLAVQYTESPQADPDIIDQQFPGAPNADQVLDKYVQALGGTQRLSAVTSIVGKGSYRNYDDFDSFSFDVYAKAPNERSIVLHSQDGDITTTFDGKLGWLASPTSLRPIPVMDLTKGNLEGAAVDAALSFPGRVKQALGPWLAGPASEIDGRTVQILQGKSGQGYPVKLYFDQETGLLVRSVRFSDSLVGRVPTQVDYSDYRDVSGVKIPFKFTTTWTDGRSVFELNSVQVNVPIEAGKFGKPNPPSNPGER